MQYRGFLIIILFVLLPLPALDALRQQVFDLSVHGAEIILRPLGDLVVQFFGQTKGHLFFCFGFIGILFFHFPNSPPSVSVLYLLSYGFPVSYSRPAFLVQASAVDDGLRFFIAAQHYQKIADHGGFALFVQIYDIIFI